MPISVLDFCPVLVDETPREALLQATHLAARVEKLGYKRFWVAEHHGAQTVASSATSVVISHIASTPRPSALAPEASCFRTTRGWWWPSSSDTLIAETAADELIVLTLMHDRAARYRSFEILAEHEAFDLG
jgi:hypothetical protein